MMREGGIAAPTTYAPVEQVAEWLDHAPAGHSCVYAVGCGLGDHPTVALVRRHHDGGAVAFKQQRSGGVIRYMVEKLPEAESASAPTSRLHPDAARVLALLADAAARGAPCPSHAEIAEILGFPTREQARYRFNALVRSGLVRVIAGTCSGGRAIEIAASGARTISTGGK